MGKQKVETCCKPHEVGWGHPAENLKASRLRRPPAPPPGPVSVAAAPREGDLSQEQHLCVRGRRQRPQGEFGGPSAVGTWGKHLLDEPRCHRRVEASLRTSPPWGKAREVVLSLALGLGLVPCKRPCGASLGDLVSVLSLKTLLLTGWLSFGQFWRPE